MPTVTLDIDTPDAAAGFAVPRLQYLLLSPAFRKSYLLHILTPEECTARRQNLKPTWEERVLLHDLLVSRRITIKTSTKSRHPSVTANRKSFGWFEGVSGEIFVTARSTSFTFEV
ncbi:hypothetical protein HK104_000631 [Borealophlyctis nickersoniae]|nr:hypothetical protein HK104_000631 [Borealophlyctis nickersoniae]